MTNIEDVIQSLLSKGEITQEDIDRARQRVRDQNKNNPKGVHAALRANGEIDIIQSEKEIEIKKRIDSGEITATTFDSLTIEEQSLTKLVLFKQYSPKLEQVPKSLSAIEFMLVALIKILDKTMDKTNLTVDESNLFDTLVTVINKNAMPINDTTHWMFQYLDAEFTKVQDNRDAYFVEKQNVTGSV